MCFENLDNATFVSFVGYKLNTRLSRMSQVFFLQSYSFPLTATLLVHLLHSEQIYKENYLSFFLKLRYPSGAGDSSAVKIIGFSFRGPGFNSQHHIAT